MATAPSASPSLLIAMVSQDVIVLAKLVRTLCPQRVLLFCTPLAKARGWGDTASRLLAGLSQERPEILGSFSVVELPDGDLTVRLETYRSSIIAACKTITESGARIDFDCTTGQGIFHVVGFDILRGIGAKQALNPVAVYCDADNATILFSTQREEDFLYTRYPIVFRYAQGKELIERFSIYGVSPRGATKIWPVNDSNQDAAVLEELYDALLQHAELRGVFHSYLNKLKMWKQCWLANKKSQPDSIKRLAGITIKSLTVKLSTLLNQPQRENFISNQITNTLNSFINAEISIGHWLSRYLADNNLLELQALLRERTARLPMILVAGPHQEEVRQAMYVQLDEFCAQLMADVRGELQRINLATEHQAAHNLFDNYHIWLTQELHGIPLPAAVHKLLLSGKRIPELFEACVGRAVARLAAQGCGKAVSAVFQNVSLDAEQIPVAELDTLILFHDGNVSVVEVKAHKGNADKKKIESNIKQIRDFTGAYSKYWLVYPLTSAELSALEQRRPEDLERFHKLGMVDHASWQGYVLSVQRSRDQRILGLDQLQEALGG